MAITPNLYIKSDISHEEQEVIDFYKKIKINTKHLKNTLSQPEKNSYKNFGIYDYSKKNRLANNTGTGELHGWA